MILPPAFPEPTSGSAMEQLPLQAVLGVPTASSEQSSVVSDQRTPLSTPDASTPQNDKNLAAANQLPASGVPEARSATDGNKLVSALQASTPILPDVPPQPNVGESAVSAQLVPPAHTDTARSVGDKNTAATNQQQANAITQTSDPSSGRMTAVDLQISVSSPGSANAAFISCVPPQSAPWQAGTTLTSSTAGGLSSPSAHAALQQAATKAMFSSTQLAAALPAAFAPQAASAKNASPAQADLATGVLPPNAPSSSRSGSQEGSSNAGAQKSSDSSATPISPVSRETSAFTQALAAANDAKPQAAPSTGNQTLVMSAVSVPLSDRPVASAAPSLPSTPANPPETASHILDGAPNPTVSDAQFSQNSNHSEMRIAMQTDNLGAVELHARVSGDVIGAAITVEKRDAHAALAVELPALQQALSDKQFRVDQITLLHSSLHSTTGDGSGQSQAQQGDRGTHRAQAAQSFLRHNSGAFISFQAVTENRGIFDSQGRLSVQA